MIKIQCDFCGKEVKYTNLYELMDSIQVAGIKDSCSDCFKEVSKITEKIRKEYEAKANEIIQAHLLNLRDKKHDYNKV